MNINISLLKKQLNIEPEFTDDDALLQHLLDVAELSVSNYCGTTGLTIYNSTTMPVAVHQAVILLAAHFYNNRNMVAFAQGTEVPYSFRFLLDPYKDFIVQ